VPKPQGFRTPGPVSGLFRSQSAGIVQRFVQRESWCITIMSFKPVLACNASLRKVTMLAALESRHFTASGGAEISNTTPTPYWPPPSVVPKTLPPCVLTYSGRAPSCPSKSCATR